MPQMCQDATPDPHHGCRGGRWQPCHLGQTQKVICQNILQGLLGTAMFIRIHHLIVFFLGGWDTDRYPFLQQILPWQVRRASSVDCKWHSYHSQLGWFDIASPNSRWSYSIRQSISQNSTPCKLQSLAQRNTMPCPQHMVVPIENKQWGGLVSSTLLTQFNMPCTAWITVSNELTSFEWMTLH